MLLRLQASSVQGGWKVLFQMRLPEIISPPPVAKSFAVLEEEVVYITISVSLTFLIEHLPEEDSTVVPATRRVDMLQDYVWEME